MHIHKLSANSSVVAAQLRNGSSINDRQPQRQNPPIRINRTPSPRVHQATDSSVGQKLAGAVDDRIKFHQTDKHRLLAVHPKLDRNTQSALNAYESLLYQSEKEERESISRLLGVDLYV